MDTRAFVPDTLSEFPRLTTVWPVPPVQSSATPSHLTTTPVVVSEPNPVTPPSPSWVPSGASAFFDFQRGNYFAGGKVVTDLTTCFAADAAFSSTFNPANITVNGMPDKPSLIGPLLQQLLSPQGGTVVVQANSVGHQCVTKLNFADSSSFAVNMTITVNDDQAGAASTIFNNVFNFNDTNGNLNRSGNRNRAAFTASPTTLALSSGKPGFSCHNTVNWPGVAHAYLTGPYDWIEAMALYPAADTTSLARLATVPPDLVTNNSPPPVGTPGPPPSALFHFDGNFGDSSGNGHTLINHGGVTTTTSQSKFGTSSAQFSGSNWLQNTDASLTFGLGDFTIDFWFKLQSAPTGQVNLYFFDDNAQVYIYILSDEIGLYAGVWGGPLIQGPQTIAANTWYHVALTNASGSVRMFCNGVQQGTTHPTTYNLANPDIVIGGGQASGSGGPVMWIDELRIIVGTAAWTANFTPPTAAYTV